MPVNFLDPIHLELLFHVIGRSSGSGVPRHPGAHLSQYANMLLQPSGLYLPNRRISGPRSYSTYQDAKNNSADQRPTAPTRLLTNLPVQPDFLKDRENYFFIANNKEPCVNRCLRYKWPDQ